jgi:hypothetical protein
MHFKLLNALNIRWEYKWHWLNAKIKEFKENTTNTIFKGDYYAIKCIYYAKGLHKKHQNVSCFRAVKLFRNQFTVISFAWLQVDFFSCFFICFSVTGSFWRRGLLKRFDVRYLIRPHYARNLRSGAICTKQGLFC